MSTKNLDLLNGIIILVIMWYKGLILYPVNQTGGLCNPTFFTRMKHYLTDLCKDVETQLERIERRNTPAMIVAQQAIDHLEGILSKLREKIVGHQFPCDDDEIYFFKHIKPRLFSNLIYYHKVRTIELSRPLGGNEAQASYLKRELDRIGDFFDRNHDFFRYHRSGSSYLDHHYFRRGKPAILVDMESFFFERDPRFSTCGDFKLAKLIASQRLQVWLQQELDLIDGYRRDHIPKRRLTWTARKVELIELIEAVVAKGCIDHGKASVQEVVSYAEMVLNIDLGNVTRTFYDLCIRSNPTRFLDELREALTEKVEELNGAVPKRK